MDQTEEQRFAVIQHEFKSTTAGISPSAGLMEHNGAILQLGGFGNQREGEGIGAFEVRNSFADELIVTGECRGVSFVAGDELRSVHQFGEVRRGDAVRRGVAGHGIEGEPGNRRGRSEVADSCSGEGNAASSAAIFPFSAVCFSSGPAAHSNKAGEGVARVKCEYKPDRQ